MQALHEIPDQWPKRDAGHCASGRRRVISAAQKARAVSTLDCYPETSGENVHRRYCEGGLRLDTDYFEKTRVWITAEADKRVAVGTGNIADTDEWNKIARRADEAKRGHEQALLTYMEHMIQCPVCSAHIVASAEDLAHVSQ